MSVRPCIAFGPKLPDAGSWQWLGEDLSAALGDGFETITFEKEVPQCDVVVFVKHKPAPDQLRLVHERAVVIYCPVDLYGNEAEIDCDEGLLSCDQIVVHCPNLTKYFRSYASTVVMDHHLKYTTPLRETYRDEGPLLWVGVRSNLAPVAAWLRNGMPKEEIWILTNPKDPKIDCTPARLGLPDYPNLRIEPWTPERHREWLAQARAVFDIKGDDFRSRHKPATKACDAIASGVPFATNQESSPREILAECGFEIADPRDRDRWLSREYWEETREFGRTLHDPLSLKSIADRWRNLIEQVIQDRAIQRKSFRPVKTIPSRELTESRDPGCAPRIAILSFLFNWPSTGGGTVHTYETAKFLHQAGYDVRHFSVESKLWQIGQVREAVEYPLESIPWEPSEGGLSVLQPRIRDAVGRFQPDFVILTDSWSMKPRLAEAVKDYPFLLRLAAQETLCPLNNVRMLVDDQGFARRCPRQQLVNPGGCQSCVGQLGVQQGELHRAERDLAGFGTADYDRTLRWSYAAAEAVLVVNPLIEAMTAPFARRTLVVPSGFDPNRFEDLGDVPKGRDRTVILFAGLANEWMKGFHILEQAGRQLREHRSDFEIWVTDDAFGSLNEYTTAIGWQSQQELPKTLAQSDIVVVPTIAEEALGRTAVEAMAVGRPIVASRIGGLPWTVPDQGTGLMFEAGNAGDLAAKLNQLLDDPDFRNRLGDNGRRRFHEHYTWNVILDRFYRPLFGEPTPSEPLTAGAC